MLAGCIKCNLSAPLNATGTIGKSGMQGACAGCWSSAWDSASTCIHPQLSRALPCLRTGEGSQQAAPPFPLSPALCGAILLVFSSRALADFCGDAKLLLQNPLIHPHGGLTPRLGFFSLLLITLLGLGPLVGAGPPCPPTMGRGVGSARAAVGPFSA